jgi:ribosomal protein S19E (S16A)
MQLSISKNEQDKIHMRTMHNIKPNSEITYSKWQQFIKTGRKDGIQKQSDFTTN